MTSAAARVLLLLAPAALLIAVPTAPAAAAGRPPSQVGVEIGGSFPRGNLAGDVFTEDLGLGIKTGLEMGFRWRFWLGERWSLSPSFHFMNYKDFKTSTPAGEDFRLKPTSYRYVLEVMWMAGRYGAAIRPFVALGGGLYHNRLEAFHKTYDRPFDESVNSFGASARAGLQLGQFEISVLYSWNRFETWVFFRTGQAESYRWDNIGVRAGWIVPFGAGSED